MITIVTTEIQHNNEIEIRNEELDKIPNVVSQRIIKMFIKFRSYFLFVIPNFPQEILHLSKNK